MTPPNFANKKRKNMKKKKCVVHENSNLICKTLVENDKRQRWFLYLQAYFFEQNKNTSCRSKSNDATELWLLTARLCLAADHSCEGVVTVYNNKKYKSPGEPVGVDCRAICKKAYRNTKTKVIFHEAMTRYIQTLKPWSSCFGICFAAVVKDSWICGFNSASKVKTFFWFKVKKCVINQKE